ncbi:Peroxisome chaperone and import receptor, partial [Oleoguttula sp. CCFEE 5521]
MTSHSEPTIDPKPSREANPEAVETAPDPDEDDLDDLDDVLDQFSAKPTPASAVPSTTAPSASGPGRPKTHDVLPSDPALEAQLAA